MGMVPYAGFSFYCFEMLKFVCMKYAPGLTCDKLERNTGKDGMGVERDRRLVCLLLLEFPSHCSFVLTHDTVVVVVRRVDVRKSRNM